MSTLLLVIRLLFAAQLLYVAVNFSLRTVLSLAAVIVVFYLTQEKDRHDVSKVSDEFAALTKKQNKTAGGGDILELDESSVPDKVAATYRQQIIDHALNYDPGESVAVEHFMPIKQKTECIFAKNARLWGARQWNANITLEENVERSIPALIKFFAIGLYCQLDGFVFELPADEFGANVDAFGAGVRRLLTCLSEADPAGVRCMRRSYIGGRGWYFEFAKTSIFVTTFAPCYSSTHSRHNFGVDGCFVLLQPEYSFAAKNLPNDTPTTNWDNPQTVRDRIRVAYRHAGREYLIRDTVIYSPALDIVKPSDASSDEVVQWWKGAELQADQ